MSIYCQQKRKEEKKEGINAVKDNYSSKAHIQGNMSHV
jgi:hypothetical protein